MVKGLARLERQIKALPQLQLDAASEALAAGADELKASIARNAPKGYSGELAKSVDWAWADADAEPGALSTNAGGSKARRALLGGLQLALVVTAGNAKAFYARFVEFGTAAAPAGRYQDARGKTRTNSQPHHATPAQPFFWPIIRAYKRRVKSRVVRNANKALKQAAKVT